MKIYTKTGDHGDTSLYGGKRRPKSDIRVAAYGEVDELQAFLGVVRSLLVDPVLIQVIRLIQNDCFTLSAELARTITKASRNDPVLTEERVIWLEAQIDHYDAELPTLTAFILQGGAPVGAQLHLARAVCRRAERAMVSLHAQENVSPIVLQYVNRLSDLLFVLARFTNQEAGVSEEIWKAS